MRSSMNRHWSIFNWGQSSCKSLRQSSCFLFLPTYVHDWARDIWTPQTVWDGISLMFVLVCGDSGAHDSSVSKWANPSSKTCRHCRKDGIYKMITSLWSRLCSGRDWKIKKDFWIVHCIKINHKMVCRYFYGCFKISNHRPYTLIILT